MKDKEGRYRIAVGPQIGQKNDDLPYVAIAYTANGIIQTGIAYRHAANEDSIAPDNIDGTVIEFATDKIDFNPADYRLQEIIVNNKDILCLREREI